MVISNFEKEKEGVEYDACRFDLNGSKIICRSSKLTPKKLGQFVTFWKRNKNGITEPFNETDPIDFFIIHVKSENSFGQFVFPKSELLNKGIISSLSKEGKRGFRVYPKWVQVENKQAKNTQQWQLKYFYKLDKQTDLKKVQELYNTIKND